MLVDTIRLLEPMALGAMEARRLCVAIGVSKVGASNTPMLHLLAATTAESRGGGNSMICYDCIERRRAESTRPYGFGTQQPEVRMATFWANPFTGIAIRLNPAFIRPAVGWNANTKHERREYIPCMQRTRAGEGQYCHASMVNPESGGRWLHWYSTANA